MNIKKILILVTASAVIIGACLYLRKSPQVPEESNEEYILAKATKVPVSQTLKPVLLYHVKSPKEVYFAGSGTVFLNSKGERRLITAEHLFGVKMGARQFCILDLVPRAPDLATDYAVNEVLWRGEDISQADISAQNDLVICSVGAMKEINSFSERNPGPSDERISLELVTLSNVTLTSLATAERVKAVAMSRNEKGAKLFLILYYSVLGQSGTGFIDDEHRLYILTGEVEIKKISPSDREKLRIPTDAPLSIVSGPLIPQKQ